MTAPATAPPRELRPYQAEAVAAVEADWSDGLRRVGVVLPTGAGKSTVIGKLVSNAYRRGQRAVMLAHRGELIDQMIRDLKAVDPTIPADHIGVVRAEQDDHHAPIVGATLQTLTKAHRRDALGKRDLIIWDEVHHAGAEGFHATFEDLGGYDDALMCGVTATMRRGDRGRGSIGLGDVIQKISYEKDLRWAINSGFLVQPRGLTVRVEGLNALNDIRTVAGDFHTTQMQEVMEAATEYVVDAIRMHAQDRRPIVFAASVAAAQAITDALNLSGVMTAEYTEGSYEDRKGIYDRFTSGQTQALVTCMILTEGADFPVCDCVVLARPTRSANLYSQMIGRALRLYEGKTDALVLDLSGSARQMRLVSLTELDHGAPHITVDGEGNILPEDDYEDIADEPPVRVRREGPVDMVSIDLLSGAESDTLWLETPAGVPFIPLPDSRVVFLWEAEGHVDGPRYAVGQINTKNKAGGFIVDQPDALHLEDAIRVAEEWIDHHTEHRIPTRGQSWRRSQPPSEAQLRLARGLRIPGYEDMTKARLSDEISIVFAKRVLDPARRKRA